MMRASRSCSAIINSNALRKTSARTRGAVLRHESKASWAASAARKQSPTDAFATVASTLPVAGFSTSMVEPESSHDPAIRFSRFVPSGSDIGRLLLQIDASDLFDPLSKKLESRLALCNDHVVSRVQEQWSRDS